MKFWTQQDVMVRQQITLNNSRRALQYRYTKGQRDASNKEMSCSVNPWRRGTWSVSTETRRKLITGSVKAKDLGQCHDQPLLYNCCNGTHFSSSQPQVHSYQTYTMFHCLRNSKQNTRNLNQIIIIFR